ncbi:MAG: HNH endonuclease [Candidatus Omnitrophota bacterium]
MESPNDIDAKVRLRVFEWLKEQTLIYGEVLPWKLLNEGVPYQNKKIRLLGPQGIFKPEILPELPLTIRTALESPYDDKHDPSGYLLYRYMGTNPNHWQNAALREAMIRKVPLVYLYCVEEGKYFPVWPVTVEGDDPSKLTFKVLVDEEKVARIAQMRVNGYQVSEPGEEDAKRRYMTAQMKYRLHQQKFRVQVLRAYREQCAMCRLRHPELLEAIHIIPDSEPKGDPVVPNGISLCNLHHTAFDRFVLGIRPDYVIKVRKDVLEEEDGPILLHGLQALNDQRLILPRSHKDHPDPDRLEIRYGKFKNFTPN